jgi:hypothetical protein
MKIDTRYLFSLPIDWGAYKEKYQHAAWKGLINPRHFTKEELSYKGTTCLDDGWVTYPINRKDWDRVFAKWCRKKGVPDTEIKVSPDEPILFMLWVEFLEEYPSQRRALWDSFRKVLRQEALWKAAQI